jgi:translation initiation factor IF-3
VDTYVFTFYYIWRCLFLANFKNNKKNDDLLINEQIRVPELMVIGPNGEQMGTKQLQDALTIAQFAGLDLVLMNAGAERPVAKIMDYNKFKYEKNKKTKEAKKAQRAKNRDVKEYQLSATIDIHDFETKRRNAEDYLSKGHKVKVSIRFKGREMAHTEVGKDIMVRFAEKLSEVSTVESEPTLEGRNMTMMLAPKNEN